MRELGERLAERGYTVLCPALAGHATTLAEMMPTRWPDWYASATAAYNQLRQDCDLIFAVGLSMGSLLALHLTAHRPIAGVVAVSTPSSIQNWRIPLFEIFHLLIYLVPAIKKNPARFDTQDPGVNAKHVAYDSYPTRAAASLIKEFLPHVMDDLRDVHAPALLIQARGDHTIPANSIHEIFSRLGSREKERVWLSQGGHLALEDYGKEEAFAHILRFVARHSANVSAGHPASRAVAEAVQE